MKTLLLLRHAKSSWDDASLGDFDRPLAERGRRDAPRMGRALRHSAVTPGLIVCSPAVRARETAQAFVKAGNLGSRLEFDQDIYAASSAELLRIIRRLPDATPCVLLVGHNPGFEDLVGRLIGTAVHMPTAALACIELSVESWTDVEDRQGRLVWFLTPKDVA